MQNKGLVKFFAILIALVSIYQLSFTFVANNVKKDAKAFAGDDIQKEAFYLDSISKETVYNLGFTSFTYNEVKDKQINKGLDLEGGINVILQINVKDILVGLSNNSTNAIFNKALDQATQNQRGNETYIDAFFRAYKEVNDGSVNLGSPEIFMNKNFSSDEVDFKKSDAQVESVVRRKVNESIESAFEVLRKRIDKFGVTQPNIQRLGESGRILVELPGVKEVDRATALLQSTAQLEFWETYKIDEMYNFMMTANEVLKASEKSTEVVAEEVEKEKSGIESLLDDIGADSTKTQVEKNPLFDKMIAFGGGPVLGVFSPKDTAKVSAYLKRDNIRALLTPEQRYAKFLWGKSTTIKNDETGESTEGIELYAIRGNRENAAPISGGVVTDAKDSFDQVGRPIVTMEMNVTGAKKWEELTGRAYTQKTSIAIVLDNIVYSAPGVSTGPISGGRSEISGNFTVNETKDLANVLKAGKLPARADIIQQDVVGPSLGQEAIDNGVISFVLGMILVILWMIFYYGKTGIYANISLLVNILFIFGILASLGAVLTLPGIAGIVLTIGMAVDANVIIFERAKEELDAGKTVEEAVDHAFTWKGAMSSIFDANITTALTALILLVFGTGPIKGFATTLLIGIGTSLFTSIFVTRILLDWSLKRKENITFCTAITKNWFKNVNIDFLAKRKIAYIISGIAIAISLGSLFTNGLNQGIDFVGGRTFQVRFDQKVVASEVSSALTAGFGTTVEAKTFGTDNQLKISTKYRFDAQGEGVDAEVSQLLFENLKAFLPKGMTYDQFATNADDKEYGLLQSTKVGPTIAEDIKTNSYYAVLGSLLVVFLYLLISFRRWQFSLGAVTAVFHDVIIVLGIYSLFYKYMPFNMEIDQAFIAAILTVIGYSLNDTVIVFDRVREFLAEQTSGTFNDVVNRGLNTTIGRTFNTSFTTMIVLLSIFILGGETIRGFVFAILVGILVGTYSSLFIATPIMADTINKQDARKKAFTSEDEDKA